MLYRLSTKLVSCMFFCEGDCRRHFIVGHQFCRNPLSERHSSFSIIRMSGCLDGFTCPHIEVDCGDKRNQIASVVAGGLFFIGWWFAIDTAANDPVSNKSFHICGVASTISVFMVNAVSNAQVRGEMYDSGCLGQTGARIWLLIGFLMGFGGLIGACWILFGAYVVPGIPDPWPGVAIFLQNFFIFFSALVFKFGRSEDIF